ncbi:hypothetical protein ACS0TY_030713 [Phlomoides rotata]
MLAPIDLVAHGWKSDNNFCTSYLVSCENAMKVVFPNTNMLVVPHITSKITAWKKVMGISLLNNQAEWVLTQLPVSLIVLMSSGKQTRVRNIMFILVVPFFILIHKSRFDIWVLFFQKDPTMHPMHYKEWPMFNDWVKVFGNDRATGGSKGKSNIVYTTKKDCASTSSGKKLKSRSENFDSSMTLMFGEFFKCTGERLENIAQRIGYDKDIGTARK